MTDMTETTGLSRARELTRQAAQWLQVIRFRARPAAPTFSTSVCHYHAMLDPDASDAHRLVACRAMDVAVQRRLLAEGFAAEAEEVYHTALDPYRLHWQTTRDGAALSAIANLLSDAIRLFEAENVAG
jgi:hypothetical protein